MRLGWPLCLVLALPFLAPAALAQSRVAYIKPQYLPPGELARVLGAHEANGRGILSWQQADGTHTVEIRRNDAANLMILTGAPDDVGAVEAMIKAADLPPRQIMVEATIVEVDESKALDVGIDWPNLRVDLNGSVGFNRANLKIERRSSSSGNTSDRLIDTRNAIAGAGNISIRDAFRLLEEKGAATFRDAPRILTLNNRRASILDGQRVTYITRYSSFTNLFETDTLDAGLTLSVLPSLGESGYLTLDIRAELTTIDGNISGSPVKDGQIVENTVIVRDGETVLLGGFLRTVEQRSRRRFPLLGTVLPFLFSREISNRSRREKFVVLTPRVVDLGGNLDARTREAIEGK